jgi:MarR family transcriptional regulator for hemolysin
MRPSITPIGLFLAQTAKRVGRAFDEALAAAGGSTPTWLVLTALMQGQHRTQAELAAVVGIQGPTLTHHLNAMETAGLVVRSRRSDNRRVHDVALTEAGRAMFHQLRAAAAAHDARLRGPFSLQEIEALRGLLGRMAEAVTPETEKPR